MRTDIRGRLAATVAAMLFGLAVPALAQTAAPQPDDPALVSCDGLTGNGLALCQLINGLNPAGNWPKGVHVNALSGMQDRATDTVQVSTETHCSSFVAAVAYNQGIYLLRPPQHKQSLLASDQFTWMWNQSVTNPAPIPARPAAGGPATPRPGWTNLGNGDQAMLDAQAYANRGFTVFASYRNEFHTADCLSKFYKGYVDTLDPAKDRIPYALPAALRAKFCPADVVPGPGHIVVIKPNAAWGANTAGILAHGPVEAQAGSFNANGATASSGFGKHFTERYVRYFVFGGVPPAQATAFAGLYTGSATHTPAYAVERTAQGALMVGLVTYDRTGAPTWYYGEGALSASDGWTTTPPPPASGPPLRDDDHPALWKPFFQPATGGVNFWDPDGDPVPFWRAGWFDLAFSPSDNTAMTVSLGLGDPGRVMGPHAAIDTDAGLVMTGDRQPLTRITALQGTTVQPPAAAAPAAGWWWAQYSLAGWNQETTGFKTYAAFLDVQGSLVNGVLLGFRPVADAIPGATVPYRPSWYSFNGSVLPNGQVDGQIMQCTQAGAAINCTAAGPATLAPVADGTLTGSFGGTSVGFSRYRTTAGNPESVTVPMPLASGPNAALYGYLMSVSVGGGAPAAVTFDTGSSGLRILKANVGSGVVATSQKLTETYADGTLFDGVLASGYVTIGGVTTPKPISFHLVETMSCIASKPNCPAHDGSMPGRVGIMGVSQDPGPISSPLAQLPAPFNQGFVASLSGGYVQLGLPAATRASFGAPVALAPLPNPVFPVPAFDRHTPMGCVSFPGSTVGRQCFHTSFDTGSSLASVAAATGTDLTSLLANGRVADGRQVAFDVTGLVSGLTVTAGPVPWINDVHVAVASGSDAHHNLGAPVLLNYDLLYDAQAGAIATRPAAR